MEYNQQRRSRGGYGYRRPMNGGQMTGPGCGCQTEPVKPDCGCSHPSPMPKPDCGCGHPSQPQKPDCGCGHPSQPQKPDCGCGRPSQPPKPDCGCGRPQPPQRPGCGCGRPSQPPKPDCGCTPPSMNEMDSFEIAMAYVPWQRWKRTYDPHRALMSGTIFPELDKPFCAAGRCSR